MVREKKLAQGAFVLRQSLRPPAGPRAFCSRWRSPIRGSAPTRSSRLRAEFARLVQDGVTEAELTKAKNGYRTQLITQQQQAIAKAEALQTRQLFLGDPEAVNTNWRRFLAVTRADIKRVAGTYFRPENSLMLLITPGGGQ